MSGILNKIDYNSRLAPSLEPKIPAASGGYSVERLGNAVLPLLAMIPVCSLVLQVAAAGKSSYLAVLNIKNNNDNKLKNCAVLVSQVASAGLLYINPLAVSIIQQTTDIFQIIVVLGNQVVEKEYKNAFFEVLNIGDKCVFVASIIVGGPQLILISMVSRGVFELYKLKQVSEKGLQLESLVQVLLIVAKAYGLSQYIEKHGQEISSSFDNLKSKCIKQISDVNETTLLNASLKTAKYYYSYATTVVWENGFQFHIADYAGGTRVVTCLNGILEGLQYISVNGITISRSANYTVHRDHVVHKYDDAKIYTYDGRQVVRVN